MCGLETVAETRDPADLTADWQRRLRWTGIDSKARDGIVRTEKEVLKAHDKAGKGFVEEVMRLHNERGYVSGEDIARILHDTFRDVVDGVSGRYGDFYTEIHERAQDSAIKKVGKDPVEVRTDKLIASFNRRTADVFPDRISDNLSGSLNRVKSLAPEVTNRLRDKLADTPLSGTTTEKVLRTMIGEEISKLDAASPAELKAAVKEIWTKTRSDLQRVIRTETINAYSKAQLQTWFDEGVREVTRHCIQDGRACPLCRELCRPGNNTYEIALLLKLEHPVTEDPWNPGEFYTHPNCRDWFEPVLGDVWADFDSMEKDLFVDMDGPTARAMDVPIDSQESVKRILNEVAIEQDFQFVPSIADMPEWQSSHLEDLLAEDPETARMLLDDDIATGGVIHWTDPLTGVTYIADDARKGTWVTLPFARRAAEWEWDVSSPETKSWWKRAFNARKKDDGKTLERDGVQVFGGEPFFSQVAGESAEAYFTEAFAYYLVGPVVLKTMDAKAYDWMFANAFDGVEYLEIGGVI